MYIIDEKDRVCQGDLYENLVFLEFVKEDDGSSLEFKTTPYGFILSQECDLQWDYEAHNGEKVKHNSFLNSILCCPAYHATDLMEGTHLYEEKNYKMREFGKPGKKENTSWKFVKQNSDPRYHYLEPFKVEDIVIPELVLDFKHYYSVPRDLFYSLKDGIEYKARLNIPFREFVSQRFAYYLSRIGLPELNTHKIDCDLDPCRAD